jgi:hypothetical protein
LNKPGHFIFGGANIGKKTSLTDLARGKRGLKRLAISTKALAI